MKILMIMALFTLSSCSTVYYSVWEKLGKEKRDLLLMHMKDANEGQEEIEEEFADSLEKIRSEYKYKKGHLAEVYDELLDDYNDINSQQETFKGRVTKVNDVAADLFAEWKTEAVALKNAKYKKDSFNKLKATKSRFNKAYQRMKKVESSTDQVLKKLHDQVVYIKHNLNAKVVGHLEMEMKGIESEMLSLMEIVKSSKKESQTFIDSL